MLENKRPREDRRVGSGTLRWGRVIEQLVLRNINVDRPLSLANTGEERFSFCARFRAAIACSLSMQRVRICEKQRVNENREVEREEVEKLGHLVKLVHRSGTLRVREKRREM